MAEFSLVILYTYMYQSHLFPSMNVVFSHGQLCRRKFNSIKTHAVVGHPCNVIVVATTTISIIVYIYALMLLVSTYSNSAIVVDPSVLTRVGALVVFWGVQSSEGIFVLFLILSWQPIHYLVYESWASPWAWWYRLAFGGVDWCSIPAPGLVFVRSSLSLGNLWVQ